MSVLSMAIGFLFSSSDGRLHSYYYTLAGLGELAFVLRPAVHRQRSNLAPDRPGSQTPGRRDRCDQHPAHLGTEPAPPSPHSLRHSRGRTLAGPPALDPPTLSFLLTRQGPQPRLSR